MKDLLEQVTDLLVECVCLPYVNRADCRIFAGKILALFQPYPTVDREHLRKILEPLRCSGADEVNERVMDAIIIIFTTGDRRKADRRKG